MSSCRRIWSFEFDQTIGCCRSRYYKLPYQAFIPPRLRWVYSPSKDPWIRFRFNPPLGSKQSFISFLAFNKSADFDTVRQIKEKHCYVAYDVEQENKLAKETTVLVETYTLPDGREIKVIFQYSYYPNSQQASQLFFYRLVRKGLKLLKRYFNLIWSISKKKASQNFYSMLSKYVIVFTLIVLRTS